MSASQTSSNRIEHKRLALTFAIWILFCVNVFADPIATELQQKEITFSAAISKLAQSNISSASMRTRVREAFDATGFGAEASDTHSADSLRAMFRAADTASFYVPEKTYATYLERLAERIEKVSPLSTREVDTVRGALVSARLFDRGAKWHARLPKSADSVWPRKFEALPAAGELRSVWFANATNQTLIQQKTVNSESLQLVAILSYGCSFSKRAMSWLLSEKAILDKLKNRSLLLIPQDRELSFQAAAEWNTRSPDVPIYLVHSEADWTFVEPWIFPKFLLVKNGVVIDEVTGWPSDGSNKQNLIALIQRLDEKNSNNKTEKK